MLDRIVGGVLEEIAAAFEILLGAVDGYALIGETNY